uniref:helix-turn-helix domain-containing protein n=1 Tax=Roseburia sp. TaxID=2049040 RepID=UPI003FEE9E01
MTHHRRIKIDSIIYDEQKMEALLQDIGKQIHAERVNQGLSISKLAELSNLSASCISKVETARSEISLKALLKITAALDVPVSYFLKDAIVSEADKEAYLTNAEKFEHLTQTAGDEIVEFILNIADGIMRVYHDNGGNNR